MRQVLIKNILPFLLLLILFSSLEIQAANTMVMGSVSIGPNQETTLPVSINNDNAFVAFQFDLPIPQGFTYVANSAILNVNRTDGHSLQASVLEGNILRILGYSLSNTPFKGSSGSIVTFRLKSNAVPGNYSLNLISPIIGNAATTNILTGSTNGILTVLAPDINIAITTLDFDRTPLGQFTDRIITVSNTGNQPLQVTNITFDNSNFSVSGNTTFTIPANQSANVSVRFNSVTKGVYNNHMTFLTNDPDESSVTVALTSYAYAVNQIHTGNVFAYSGHDASLSFTINNMETFTGFQFDLVLPTSLSYVPGSATLSNRKTNHVVSANMINSNTLRVVAFSTNNQSFAGIDGMILTMGFSALGNGGYYGITMQNAVIGDAGGQNIISDYYSGQLQIAAASLNCNSSVLFGDVSVIETSQQNLTIHNYGTDTLKISQLLFTNPVFSTSAVLPVNILPGQQKNIQVLCHSLTKGNVAGILKIVSNDPVNTVYPVTLSAKVYIPNYLIVPDISSKYIDTIQIPIKVNNMEPFTGFQFDMSFPACLTYINNSAALTTRAQGHLLQASLLNSTKVRVIAFSMDQKPFLGDTGSVVMLSFSVHAQNNEPSAPLILSEAILGNAQSQNILYGQTNGIIKFIPATPVAPTASATLQPTCTVATGTITVSAPTGTGMTYSINGTTYTNTNGIFTIVPAGTYSVTARNAAGYTSSGTSVTINTQPATPVAPTASATLQPTCTVATGTITVTAPTGTGMTYSINGTTYTNTNGIFTLVPAGNYTVTARNAAGCTSSGTSVTISAQSATPVAPTASATLQPTCTVATGAITVTAPTGTGMTYSINGTTYTNTNGIFTLVPAGNYTVIARNAAGCTSSGTSVTINAQPATPVVPTANATLQPTCTVATGAITVTAPTGTGMTYSINGTTYTNTNGIFTLVPAGNYTVTARNAAGCTSSGTSVTINAQPVSPNIVNQTTSILTGGTFTVTPTGTPAGTTYTWTTPTYTNGVSGGNAQTSQQSSISGSLSIPSGTGTATYIVTPTSGSCVGSTFTLTVTVTSLCVPVTIETQPSDIIMCTTSGNASFTIGASGTTPFIYQWQYNNGGTWENVVNETPAGASYADETSAIIGINGITSIGSFQYRCTIKNCSGSSNVTSNNATLTINAKPSAPIIESIIQPSCLVSIGSVVLGGLPAGNWSINPGAITGLTSNTTISGLIAGSYTFTVMNESGCISSGTEVTINLQPVTPVTPYITLNGDTLHSNAPSGNQWYNKNGLIYGETNQDLLVTTGDEYYVVVTINGCSSDQSNHILNVGIKTTEYKKIIKVYPNPVTNELTIEIKGNTQKMNFEIFNSLSQIVFKGNLVEKTVVQTSNLYPDVYIIRLENKKSLKFIKIIQE